MEDRSCPICGGQLALVRIMPELYFYINERGQVKRDTNPDYLTACMPDFEPICTNDRTHAVYPIYGSDWDIFNQWLNNYITHANKIIKREGL